MKRSLAVLLVAGLVCLSACDAAAQSKDPFADVETLKILAESGDPEAQYLLNMAYFIGIKMPKDAAESLKWLRRSADRGFPQAQSELGGAYSMGNRVPRNDIEAYKWYALAATAGYTHAAESLKLLEQSMTPEQIAEGQRLAAEWKPMASEE